MPKIFTVLASLAGIAGATADAASMAKVAGLSDTATFGLGGSFGRLPSDHDRGRRRLKK